jgi:hypothetical protein
MTVTTSQPPNPSPGPSERVLARPHCAGWRSRRLGAADPAPARRPGAGTLAGVAEHGPQAGAQLEVADRRRRRVPRAPAAPPTPFRPGSARPPASPDRFGRRARRPSAARAAAAAAPVGSSSSPEQQEVGALFGAAARLAPGPRRAGLVAEGQQLADQVVAQLLSRSATSSMIVSVIEDPSLLVWLHCLSTCAREKRHVPNGHASKRTCSIGTPKRPASSASLSPATARNSSAGIRSARANRSARP